MHDAAVQKHRAEDRHNRVGESPAIEPGVEKSLRHESDRLKEGIQTFALENLEEEGRDVRDDEQPRDEGHGPARERVANRNHARMIRASQGRRARTSLQLYFRRLFSSSFRSLPARNRATFAAAMRIAAFVRGLTPVRALRSATWKIPRPGSATRSPFLRLPAIALTTESSAEAASFRVKPVSVVIASTMSDLPAMREPPAGSSRTAVFGKCGECRLGLGPCQRREFRRRTLAEKPSCVAPGRTCPGPSGATAAASGTGRPDVSGATRSKAGLSPSTASTTSSFSSRSSEHVT